MKYLLLATTLLFLLSACRKEDKFTTSKGDKLEFSVDTLRFDTVFTELGSDTRFFRVYNRHSESIRISKIQLVGNQQSKFNLNVDGIPGDEHENVVVLPHDSIYVFVEVKINPDEPLSSSPFFVYDSIRFETNGNVQFVTLEAFGQNANYIPSRWSKDSITLYSCGGGEVIWDDPKPYVIYGVVAFNDCTLTIPAGARIHVHGGLSRTIDPSSMETVIYNSGRLFFLENGKLNVQGTAENPVIFEGDRLEEDFQDADGQWTGIIFGAESNGHKIEHAIIKNSLFGLYVDSLADVTLKNVQVFNTSGVGLFAYHCNVTAENCLFYNNGTHCVQLGFGGNYEFKYCTLANYGTDAAALNMGNGICLDEFCGSTLVYPLEAAFTNCIIYGNKRDEIILNDLSFKQGTDPLNFSYQLDHCIVKVDQLTDPNLGYPDFFSHCNACLNPTPQEALFADINEDDYHLDTLSVAEQKALPLPGILMDLEGNDRDPAMPDLGCFEYIYK